MLRVKYFFLALFFVSGFTPISASAEEACDDSGKIYRICQDQKTIFAAAAEKAIAEKKNLLVVFGADWCPWCRSLNTMLNAEEVKESISPDTVLVEIGVYKEQDKLPSGEEVLAQVIGYSKAKVNRKGVPLMALVDPVKKKAVFVDTAPLEKNTKVSKGHDPKKVSDALKKAAAKLK